MDATGLWSDVDGISSCCRSCRRSRHRCRLLPLVEVPHLLLEIPHLLLYKEHLLPHQLLLLLLPMLLLLLVLNGPFNVGDAQPNVC